MALLTVRDLRIAFPGATAVDGLSFSLEAGESLGIAGESGSGKTQTALAIMGLSPRAASVSGSVVLDNQELLGLPAARMNQIRPQRIAMVFQDPRQALNPYVRVGDQLTTILLQHKLASADEAPTKTLAMLRKVGLPDADRQYAAFPHQLSGGMRQRAMIASALLAEPDVLIADEPTTALDVTVQAQILSLLRGLREQLNLALLLITHDLGVIAGNCDNMLVVDSGRQVESGPVRSLFANPAKARTRDLINAFRYEGSRSAVVTGSEPQDPILSVAGLAVSYRERHLWRRRNLDAVQALDLHLKPGETLAIVGESGSGKTSLARAVLGLTEYRSGQVSFLGKPLAKNVRRRPPGLRRQLQMVFQDPGASLDPAMRVDRIVGEPLLVHETKMDRADRAIRVAEMLRRVGLPEGLHTRLPHELSGGQAQRVAIARALILEPRVLVCDEAVAALDGTVRSEILELLDAERERLSLSLIMITHDLGIVRRMADRVLVMYLGRVCELSAAERVFRRPGHPYTQALLDSMPVADPDRRSHNPPVAGEAASVLHPPNGCVFHPRCAYAQSACAENVPELRETEGSRQACLRAEELQLPG